MSWLIIKYALTAVIIVLISEIAKRTEKLGALITALPLVALLALCWLYIEGQSQSTISNYSRYTFWYVLPTLPMFMLFPILFQKLGFWQTMGACVLITAVCFILLAIILRRFGIDLMF